MIDSNRRATRAAIARAGPLCFSGNIRIELAAGEVVTVNEAALCRCGASRTSRSVTTLTTG